MSPDCAAIKAQLETVSNVPTGFQALIEEVGQLRKIVNKEYSNASPQH